MPYQVSYEVYSMFTVGHTQPPHMCFNSQSFDYMDFPNQNPCEETGFVYYVHIELGHGQQIYVHKL